MPDAAPVIVSVTLFLVVGAVLILFLVNRHREHMQMIERGFTPEQMHTKGFRWFSQMSTLGSLKWGIIIFATGFAIMTGMILENSYHLQDIGPLYPGIIFLYAGAGLVVYYMIASRKTSDSDQAEKK